MTREQQIVSLVRASRGSLGVAALCLSLAACGSAGKLAGQIDPKYGVSASPKVVADGQPVPKGGGAYRVGKPYVIAGRTYVPQENPNYTAEGIASWYGDDFHGRLTANGEVFDRTSISAAHPTLPMPSYVRVTNLNNGRSIIVRVNDRGPYHQNRVIDVSHRTADLLGFSSKGVAKVRVDFVSRAPLDGSDDRKLVASLRQDGGPAEVPANSAVQVASAAPFVPSLPMVMPQSAPGEIPVPLQRPFDLGHAEAGEQVADATPAPAPMRAAAVHPVEAPQVASRPAARPVTVASSSQSSSVSSAPNATAAIHAAAPGPAGWSVGAAPVSGLSFTGVSTSSGR
ncbi:septal ring lytic transglycosylase RlpA family protein [Azorhizobium doebereinerae]|uniref:septal ring lytic transglycosylase RlpA family protein n=1 Tax=Azorhizobium doebereinerae TaxID=281091 RepID=UPI000490FDF4|nr:septal ring lytic transglycosylase RlpA family protein [Azorhizobium doebereinerae]